MTTAGLKSGLTRASDLLPKFIAYYMKVPKMSCSYTFLVLALIFLCKIVKIDSWFSFTFGYLQFYIELFFGLQFVETRMQASVTTFSKNQGFHLFFFLPYNEVPTVLNK